MKAKDLFSVIIFGGLIFTTLLETYESYKFWEESVDNLARARNALDDNLALLEIGLVLEQKSGYLQNWTDGRAMRIAELKIDLDIISHQVEELRSLSYISRLFFKEREAVQIKALYVQWSLERRESIAGVHGLVNEYFRKLEYQKEEKNK